MSLRVIMVKDLNRYANRPGVVIIDLRERQKYLSWHFPGAINVLPKDLKVFLSKERENKLFVLYCDRGIVSSREAKHFSEQGYQMGTVAGGMSSYKKYMSGKIDSLN